MDGYIGSALSLGRWIVVSNIVEVVFLCCCFLAGNHRSRAIFAQLAAWTCLKICVGAIFAVVVILISVAVQMSA